MVQLSKIIYLPFLNVRFTFDLAFQSRCTMLVSHDKGLMDTGHALGSLKGSFSTALDFALIFFLSGKKRFQMGEKKISSDTRTCSCFPLETGNC